jgi:ribosomal protein S18 acetylase RimI-like enzyme
MQIFFRKTDIMRIKCKAITSKNTGLILDFMKDYYSTEGIMFDREKSRDTLENLISHEDTGRIWIIETNKAAIGYFCLAFCYTLEHHGKACYLDEMYIKPEFRHLGIGSEAMKFIENYLINNEFKAIHLVVHLKNLAAFNYYIKNGFHVHDASFMTKVL